MLFQISSLFLMITLSFALQAAAEQSSLEKSFNQEVLLLNADQKNQLLQADAYIQRQLGFVNMKSSGRPAQRISIFCLNAKAGLLVLKGSGSICRAGGEKPNFYTIGVVSGGLAAQWMSGVYIGYIETKRADIAGVYPVLSIGFSPGLSADVLFGKSEEFGKLFLAGIGVGFGVEITGGKLYLQPIFEGQ